MSKLNQEERRYALRRVDEITKAREERLREKHTKPVKGLTAAEKLRQIQRGDAYRMSSGWNLSTPIGECYIFDSADKGELDNKAFRKDMAALRKEKAKVGDAIVLGDAEEAKKLLAAYEKTV